MPDSNQQKMLEEARNSAEAIMGMERRVRDASVHAPAPLLAQAVLILFEQAEHLRAEAERSERYAEDRDQFAQRLEEQFDALRHAAGDFVTAYRAASMSDEEGLLMATDPDAMRQLWHRVDEAATDVEQAL